MTARVIKKYANRRLYDTKTSKYITMSEIRDLIVGGADVRIIDEGSGEDTTRHLLVKILSEQEQGGKPVLSERTLMQIIRFYGHPMQAFMTNYIEQGVDAFASQQHEVMNQMNASVKDTPFEAMQENLTSAVATGMKSWIDAQEAMISAVTPKEPEDKK